MWKFSYASLGASMPPIQAGSGSPARKFWTPPGFMWETPKPYRAVTLTAVIKQIFSSDSLQGEDTRNYPTNPEHSQDLRPNQIGCLYFSHLFADVY